MLCWQALQTTQKLLPIELLLFENGKFFFSREREKTCVTGLLQLILFVSAF